MSRLSYWEDALGEALSAVDAFDLLTDEQKKSVAADLMVSAQMQAEAFGDLCIPNPSIAEMRLVKEAHRRELEDAERRAEIWKQEACRIARVEPSRAYINNGEVYVSRT